MEYLRVAENEYWTFARDERVTTERSIGWSPEVSQITLLVMTHDQLEG
jgi:hypothetical protein